MTNWRSLDDLEAATAALSAQTPEGGDEFADPVEAPEMDGTTRRHFMGVMGASMAMASLSGCVRRPEAYIAPYSRTPEEFLPGIKQHFATSTSINGNAIGLLVESHEGRPTKIEGNPDHPMSFGKTSAVHQGLVLDLYDPVRMRMPRKAGSPTTWDAANTFVTAHFKALRQSRGKGVAILSPAVPGPSFASLKTKIQKRMPDVSWHTFEPVSDDNQREGLRLTFGQPLRPRFELNMATTVFTLGSDALVSEGDSVANAYRWAQTRKLDSPKSGMSRLYTIEAAHSVTGTCADHRLRVPASRHEQVAWALVDALATLGKAFPVLSVQTAKTASAGLDAKTRAFVDAMAADLADGGPAGATQRFGLMIAGQGTSSTTHALAALINLAIGGHGKTVFYFPDLRRGADELGDMESLKGLVKELNDGKVDTLVVLGQNPVYTAPGDIDFAAAMRKAKTSIVLADYRDETAMPATWALPRAHFLETWGDTFAVDGTTSIQQPLIAPLHGAWSELELLARVVGEERTDGHGLVREYWKSRQGAVGFHKKWRRWLHDGVLDKPFFGSHPVFKRPQDSGQLKASAVGDMPTARNLEIVFVPDPNLYDGRYANNSWLQEAPDPITKVTWDNTFQISLSTAETLNIESEDRVTVSVGGKAVDGVAWVTPGIAEGTVIATLGYGRAFSNFLPYHDDGKVGFDVNPLRSTAAPFSIAGAKLTKKAGKYIVACVQRFNSQEPGFGYEARPLVREADLADYRKKPNFAQSGILEHGKPPPDALVVHPPTKSLYGDWDYSKGYQWGLAIDLNSCTGCNTCLVACVAENNIMSVGKDQVRRGRELHWIRMDRYFVGNDDEARVVHQPMTCQQCENAPCENVCPVAATVHSPEGLNDMAYNRCIGTRYCANNCPFKVRRFNFYNYSKGQPELIHMVRNPNVTVRFRGVMEKCTYCVQRINTGKRQAKMADDAKVAAKIIDSIQTACQQACPADAITFGDINNPQSKVARLKKQDRDYLVLRELNLKPRTSYLAKVSNPNPKMGG